MTAWHYRWLCQFSYIDLPPEIQEQTSLNLGQIAHKLLTRHAENRLPLSPNALEALHVIRQTPELSELQLIDFINRNSTSGFVVYVLQSSDKIIHCIFRGSESKGRGVPNRIDWLDNFLAPFLGSVQYPDITDLIHRFHGRTLIFSGHSKGAHNALYALSLFPEESARALTFNGQGFSPAQLSLAQRTRLAQRGINYVVCGDVVGSLLYHPEQRVFVRKQGTDSAHALSSFSFEKDGSPIPCARPLPSWGIEWATRAYLHLRYQCCQLKGGTYSQSLPCARGGAPQGRRGCRSLA